MRQALNAFAIRGINSNIPFQAALLAHPKFVAGDFNTGFIAEQFPKGFRPKPWRTTTRPSCVCWRRWRTACTRSVRCG
jgi:propionyl-CoA carboxylase alpha chain